jgi:hypothetical protein
MSRIIALFFVLQLIFVIPGSVDAAPVISIGDYEIQIGEIETIDVLISDISDTIINTFDFTLEFNADGLMASNLLPGSSVPSPMWFQGQIDNDNGTVKALYSVFMPPQPQIDTDGIIASFDLTGLIPGVYDLRIANVSFSDTTTPVIVETINGSISVVPIPPALLLLGSGLVGIIGLRRRMTK